TLDLNNAGTSGSALSNYSVATIANSTFYKNTATAGNGAIEAVSGTTLLLNSTLSHNTGANYGAFYQYAGASLALENTIIANSLKNNTAQTNCGVSKAGVKMSDAGHNLRFPMNDNSCVGMHGDPALGALANNGGPTKTMSISFGSAAFMAGDNSG